jgi:hypothetical protein
MGMDLTGAKKAQKTQVLMANQAANDAREAEEARVARIKAGQGTIDKNFQQFDDGYFSNYKKANLDYYNPQVDNQYTRAQDKLKAQLAGQGILESGVGNQAMADLAGTYASNKAQIASGADDAVTQLKGRISDNRTGLYNAAQSAGDPAQLASLATASSTALASPTNYSPLADLFAGALNSYGVYNQTQAYKAAAAGGGGGSFSPDYSKAFGGGGDSGSSGSPSVSVIK